MPLSHVEQTRPQLLRNFLQRRASSSPPPSSDIASETVFASKEAGDRPPYDPAFEVVDRVIASKPGKAADGTR